MDSQAPYIVGICGGSGSGKTYLLTQLMKRLPPESTTLISQDNYYHDAHTLHKTTEGLINWDHPETVDLSRLHQDIETLKKGQTVEVTEYLFNKTDRPPNIFRYTPTPLIIVEGIFIFVHSLLEKSFALKVFLEADEHIKILRRIRRDEATRGYDYQEVLRDYERFVAPMYRQFVEPTKRHSDLIIPNNADISKAVEVLAHHLEQAI